MATNSEEETKLLEYEYDDAPIMKPLGRKDSAWSIKWCIATAALALSAGLNCVLLLSARSQNHALADESVADARTGSTTEYLQNRVSPYSGLANDTPYKFRWHTPEWWEGNETHARELWENIQMDSLVIAVTPEWAEEKQLPPTWEFPWDPEHKRIYFVKVFHQLHCMKVLRRAFLDYEQGGSPSGMKVPPHHIEHCLDTIREDIMCYADDTPMPSVIARHGVGEGQTLQCRSLEKVAAWAKEPERDACYRHVHDDYRGIRHGMERFAFCKPDSPYYETMKAYFDYHGHKDPFEEGFEFDSSP